MSKDTTTIQLKFNKQQNKMEILADKMLTLRSLPSLQESWSVDIKKMDKLIIHLSDVEEVDINGLQFILYLIQVQDWKKIDLKLISNEQVVNTLKATGFEFLMQKVKA